ncbi:PREDICTED: uncharacterized protein LOC108558543 [Nicrophorus vespilloides]|uniref:Uncharacterized protein LOC108558543 n=1 Tax=Nicrophorus vespilloides TaxID=110193 RepID=A0ABM1M8S5_NICVS|nr:PREDICTED: uncharacterized protein LOC108558543 [Nicrophorus vespilloides]
MTLNHSKTWPVSTLAVVQLRVDPNGRTYSTQLEPENNPMLEPQQNHEIQDESVLPLCHRNVEMFTRSQRCKQSAIRTDTISTVLDHDLEDLDAEPTDRLHVVALGRIDEVSNGEQETRRPSIKVDNWDLIYTERDSRNRKKLCPACTELARKPMKPATSDLLLPPDLPLDARKATTLRRHYYPEGGWGWIIIACTILVHILNVGLQMSCSQLITPAADKFKTSPVHIAGKRKSP